MPIAHMSVGVLLNEKEQEVARLREQALTSLEAKASHMDAQSGQVPSSASREG